MYSYSKQSKKLNMAMLVNQVPKSQIEAVQTVSPFEVTDPREVRVVSAAEPPIGSAGIFLTCLKTVFFFNKAMEDESGWVIAGWIKESLARALKEQPMLSGRLRRGENGDGELEIVSNDSGVGLLEAKISMGLKDFLDLKDGDVAVAEAELVFWKHIDQQNPQFSPLFYVQITNFQCGGYSIGISCSILLADILITNNFLQKWANIQRELLSKNGQLNKVPIFYLPSLKPPNVTANGHFKPTPFETSAQTMIFKVKTGNLDIKNLALFCIEEAEQKLGNKKLSSEFNFLVKECSKFMKFENCKKNYEVVKSNSKNGEIVDRSNLKDYLGMEISFREGNKPTRVSYWIDGVSDDGFVMAIPSSNDGVSEFNFIITMPK